MIFFTLIIFQKKTTFNILISEASFQIDLDSEIS